MSGHVLVTSKVAVVSAPSDWSHAGAETVCVPTVTAAAWPHVSVQTTWTWSSELGSVSSVHTSADAVTGSPGATAPQMFSSHRSWQNCETLPSGPVSVTMSTIGSTVADASRQPAG